MMALFKRKKKDRHSPAGRRYLEAKKKAGKKKYGETSPVYFKTVKRKSNIERLKAAGLSDADLKSLGYKGK